MGMVGDEYSNPTLWKRCASSDCVNCFWNCSSIDSGAFRLRFDGEVPSSSSDVVAETMVRLGSMNTVNRLSIINAPRKRGRKGMAKCFKQRNCKLIKPAA